ncbi:hypothetical protein AB0425_25725 [Actinosynnema sp. NPDC051121]
MTETWHHLHVTDHGFGLLDRGELPMTPGPWSNGLVRPLPSGALVFTGISQGHVRVRAVAAEQAPASTDTSSWEEIVDVSVTAPHGELRVDSYEDGPAQTLPLLSSHGPGTYRLRVHARGRDLYYDRLRNEPSEDYLIVSWPAPPAAETIIRATDRCGLALRQTLAPSSNVAPPTPDEAVRPDAFAANHQAILGLIAQPEPSERPDKP